MAIAFISETTRQECTAAAAAAVVVKEIQFSLAEMEAN